MIVCKYKFDSNIYNNLIPEFNSGYNGYSVNDTIDGNIITRTIECDTLPTFMRFGQVWVSEEVQQDYTRCLLEVLDINTSELTSCSSMFRYCTNLTQLDVSNFNTSKVNNMYSMFSNCNNLTQLDVSNFNTSQVNNMYAMFHNCNNLTQLDVSNFNTSQVTNMQSMFNGCNNLTQLDVSNFNTSQVNNMYAMFHNCNNLIQLDLSNFDTSNVADMRSMFYNCTNLTQLDLSNFDTSNVTSMYCMFTGCTNLTSLDISNFNVINVADFTGFLGNTKIKLIKCLNPSTINTLIQYLPNKSSSSNGVIIIDNRNGLNVSELTNKNWSIISTSDEYVITEYKYDKSIYFDFIPEFNSSYDSYFIYNEYNDEDDNIVTRKIVSNTLPTLMRFGSSDSSGTGDYTRESSLLEVMKLITDNLNDMSLMFYNCNNLAQLDVSNFNTSNVTDMYAMFSTCRNLTQLDVSNFNTSNVTSMQNMFYNCSNLTQLDLSNFDTSNVINMRNMFYNCNNLTQLDVSNFNTSNVTSMYAMFSTCRNLTQLDLSNFNTSNVASMRSMFNNCTNLTSLDISNFNTSNVTNMYTMFQNCNNLTQLDLSNFNTSKVTDMDYMFNNTSKLVNIGMIYCNENTVLKIKEAITNGNVNIWIDENIILPNNTNYVTFKHFKECNKTLYLNSPLLEGDTIEEIEGKTYHVKRYEKIVLDGNENLVNFEEKENTCFVNVIYSPLGKQQGNLICDKFVIGEAYDNDIECIDLHTLNGNLHFNIAKSKLNKISVQGILEYLQQNPATIVYELAEPIYELVSDDSLLLDSYSGGNLSLDTNITLDKISFTSYEEELTYLYPNTLYTVQFYANNDGIGNVMLGGSLLENKEIVRGLNNIHITTPNVLSNNKLNISTTSGNIYISNVVVTNTGMEFNYFEGMKSTFEDMYIDDIDNKYYGKYKVECKIVGKNKFDKTDFTLYKLWREDGTIGGESVQNGASKLLPVTPNTKYKCSNNEGWNQVLYFDKNKKYIGNEVSGRTNIITPSNCYYIGVNLRITALDIFQIEEGTIATEYTPYREYNTAVYLNSPLLQGDKIMVKDNKLCHYHKMGIREYQEGDLDNYITDLINTIYLLTEPYYEDITPIQSSFVIPTVLEGDMEILTNLPIKSNITYMTNITSAVMLERQLDEIDSGTNSLSDILDGEINE